ncbi:MAG: TatD family hydrolase, partial [Halobacteriaceae archaeon]
MEQIDTPILDNHLHLDLENGKGIDAVRDFSRVGGTHLLVVNKPSWQLDVAVEEGGDFDVVFEKTIDIATRATEVLDGRAWAVLGVHPTLITRLVEEREFDPGMAANLMKAGIDRAGNFAKRDDVVALKSGRPHYDTSKAVWEASN